jgi:hypothetical protein
MLRNLRTGERVASGFALAPLVLVALTLVGIVRVNNKNHPHNWNQHEA